jgi:ankyrin repeat protein
MSDSSSLLTHGGDAMVPAKRLSLLVLVLFCFATIASAPGLAGKLTDALKLRDIAQVRSLLAAGEDLQEKVQGDYPLNVAALFGPAEMVTVLLDAGADIKRPGRDGLHPLHNAIAMGHRDIVALLIQRGAVVDAKDRRGRTPLYSFAATGGSDIEIAKMLLAAGADPKIEDEEYHETGLNSAAEYGNLELGKLLIAAHVDVNHRNVDGWSALHYAAHHLRHEFVKLLIAAGADVNAANKLGRTPISYAPNDAAIRQLLTAAGAK